jgi:hypothetical protein
MKRSFLLIARQDHGRLRSWCDCVRAGFRSEIASGVTELVHGLELADEPSWMQVRGADASWYVTISELRVTDPEPGTMFFDLVSNDPLPMRRVLRCIATNDSVKVSWDGRETEARELLLDESWGSQD